MPDEEIPLLERVASYYKQLSTVAADLNAVSDELGKSIAEIDAALKKLNLGIATWVTIRGDDESPYNDLYWSRDIGYAKVNSKWGISLRTINGQCSDPDRSVTEEWLFNDAPRSLRLEAIDKIPELLEKLSQEAVRTTKDIRARLSEAQAVADVVKGASKITPRATFRIPPTALNNMGTQVKVPEAKAVRKPFALNLDSIRQALCSVLLEAGHTSAAHLIVNGSWSFDGACYRIEVAGMGNKMLTLTVNAAAEKIIRKELQRLGVPSQFLVVPGKGIVMSTTPITTSEHVTDASTEVK
jgi:hypothetical protein